MAFTYPDKPWQDGQTIKKTIAGREVVVAKYDASKNLWVHLEANDNGYFFYANACQVSIDRSECGSGECPPQFPILDWCEAQNVQYAMDWLHYYLDNALDRIKVLEMKVEALENE